jgi:hypothetical protein
VKLQTLLRILHKRLGEVSDSTRDRIHSATTNELEVWIEASLDAATLDEIFHN